MKQRKIINKCASGVDPLVKELYHLMKSTGRTYLSMSIQVGVSQNIFTAWFHGRSTPNVSNLEACLNVLGYELKIIKREGN